MAKKKKTKGGSKPLPVIQNTENNNNEEKFDIFKSIDLINKNIIFLISEFKNKLNDNISRLEEKLSNNIFNISVSNAVSSNNPIPVLIVNDLSNEFQQLISKIQEQSVDRNPNNAIDGFDAPTRTDGITKEDLEETVEELIDAINNSNNFRTTGEERLARERERNNNPVTSYTAIGGMIKVTIDIYKSLKSTILAIWNFVRSLRRIPRTFLTLIGRRPQEVTTPQLGTEVLPQTEQNGQTGNNRPSLIERLKEKIRERRERRIERRIERRNANRSTQSPVSTSSSTAPTRVTSPNNLSIVEKIKNTLSSLKNRLFTGAKTVIKSLFLFVIRSIPRVIMTFGASLLGILSSPATIAVIASALVAALVGTGIFSLLKGKKENELQKDDKKALDANNVSKEKQQLVANDPTYKELDKKEKDTELYYNKLIDTANDQETTNELTKEKEQKLEEIRKKRQQRIEELVGKPIEIKRTTLNEETPTGKNLSGGITMSSEQLSGIRQKQMNILRNNTQSSVFGSLNKKEMSQDNTKQNPVVINNFNNMQTVSGNGGLNFFPVSFGDRGSTGGIWHSQC